MRSSQLLAFLTVLSTASTVVPTAVTHGERSAGAEPCTNGSSTAPGQPLSPRRLVCGSIQTVSMRSGLGSASGSGASAAIISPHTRRAPRRQRRAGARELRRPVVVVADPDHGEAIAGETGEPGVALLVRRSGFSG